MNVVAMWTAVRSWTAIPDSHRQFELLRRFGAKLGPYFLLEVLLPGGTLFALLLLLYQRWTIDRGSLPTLRGLASPPELVRKLGRTQENF